VHDSNYRRNRKLVPQAFGSKFEVGKKKHFLRDPVLAAARCEKKVCLPVLILPTYSKAADTQRINVYYCQQIHVTKPFPHRAVCMLLPQKQKHIHSQEQFSLTNATPRQPYDSVKDKALKKPTVSSSKNSEPIVFQFPQFNLYRNNQSRSLG
jgi:hypothetical protein